MALYRLSTETMVGLSKAWVETQRDSLQTITPVSAILPILEAAHKRLFVFKGQDLEPASTKEISKKQTETDHQHDDFYRSGFYQFNSQIALSSARGKEAEAKALLELRDHLYPDALFGVNRSYLDEEGGAELLERRLTGEIKEKLKRIYIQDNFSLLGVIEKQIEKARELGALEKEKQKLEAQSSGAPSASDERRARYDWIEAVRMLERTLRLAVRQKMTTEAFLKSTLAELQREEAEVDRKYNEEKKKEQEKKEAKKEEPQS